MITREFGDGGYCAAGAGNPPPLHVRDTESMAANWHPLPRPYLQPTPPGPVMVRIPHLPADELGEDPTDPARCHGPRIPTAGMASRFNLVAGQHNVRPGGVRA